jgi:hypothetical protein
LITAIKQFEEGWQHIVQARKNFFFELNPTLRDPLLQLLNTLTKLLAIVTHYKPFDVDTLAY